MHKFSLCSVESLLSSTFRSLKQLTSFTLMIFWKLHTDLGSKLAYLAVRVWSGADKMAHLRCWPCLLVLLLSSSAKVASRRFQLEVPVRELKNRE